MYGKLEIKLYRHARIYAQSKPVRWVITDSSNFAENANEKKLHIIVKIKLRWLCAEYI